MEGRRKEGKRREVKKDGRMEDREVGKEGREEEKKGKKRKGR